MKKATRQRVERQLKFLMEKDGDNCTICRKPYLHNSKTVGGVTCSGTPAVAGECCADKITEVVLSGVYVNRNQDAYPLSSDNVVDSGVQASELGVAVDKLQERVAALDAAVDGFRSDTMKRAGLPQNSARVVLEETPWKSDDAAWFEGHPNRSHRLRPALPGESQSWPTEAFQIAMPPGHELYVLVRQVQPGRRVRTPFYRDISTPIPDIEAVIHALFDRVSDSSGKAGTISVNEIAELANRYLRARILEP